MRPVPLRLSSHAAWRIQVRANVEGDADWWIPSGKTFFSPKHLSDNPQQELTYAREHWLLPCRYRDLFHSDGISVESCVTYDKYDLLMVETRDPLGNRVTVGERDASGNVNPESPGYDYRLFTTKAGHKREPQPY